MSTNVVRITENKKQVQQLHQIFREQTTAFAKNRMPGYDERVTHLKKLRASILDNQDALIECVTQDFSGRSSFETKLAELMTTVHGIDYALKNLKSWMAERSKKIAALFQPATGVVQYQPLGVVGIISPWNYPLSLALGPLVAALAAGNRVMIKTSEYTPLTSAYVADLLADIFPRDLVAVINGDAEVATEFSSMPWNHLLFTGSTAVGRQVMRAAAANLTPVTLELGGKSPTIIAGDADMDAAAQAIAFGKAFNAGQTCIAPDYVLCPEQRIEYFVDRVQFFFGLMYPTLKHNDDFTSIINDRQFQRLQSILQDARSKGAKIIECNPADEDMSTGTRKMPIYLVLNPTEEMRVLQEEIFGPILPIIATRSTTEALEFINQRPSPLALYYFGHDQAEQRQVLDQVRAGGVCINDTLAHFAQDDLQFGGVGESGMGSYHGDQGFITFSHAKSVFSRKRFNSTKMAYPPYGRAIHKMLLAIFLRELSSICAAEVIW